MKTTWWCVVSCVAFVTVPVAAETTAQPKIHSDKPVHKFGKAWNDKIIEHTFVIKNVGQAPLQIKGVRNTCGCAVVKVEPQTLAPGASLEVKVKLNPKNLEKTVKKSVYIESNDPTKPLLALSFEGEVRRPITMVPAFARFKALDRLAPSTLDVTLINNLDEPMTLANPRSSVKGVSVKIAELEKGKKYKVTLTANPPYTGNVFHGKVTLDTGMKKRPEYVVSFFGRLPPPVEIRPATVFNLGTLDNTKEYSRTVHVVSTDGSSFGISEISSNNWRVLPSVREVSPGRDYEVQITARPPYEWGINRGYVTFKTGSGPMDRLTVQVYGELPRPIDVVPRSLLFRNLRVNQGGETSVTLKVTGAEPIRISSARSSLPEIKTRIETVVEGKEYKLTAIATPPLKPGRLRGEIVLATSHAGMKTLTVPVQSLATHTPVPDVTVVPDPVLVLPSSGPTTKLAVSRFFVRANNGQKVRVTKVEVSHKDITSMILPFKGAEDTMSIVRIMVPADAAIRPEGELATIYTDNKAFPKVVRRIARANTPGASVRSGAPTEPAKVTSAPAGTGGRQP